MSYYFGGITALSQKSLSRKIFGEELAGANVAISTKIVIASGIAFFNYSPFQKIRPQIVERSLPIKAYMVHI